MLIEMELEKEYKKNLFYQQSIESNSITQSNYKNYAFVAFKLNLSTKLLFREAINNLYKFCYYSFILDSLIVFHKLSMMRGIIYMEEMFIKISLIFFFTKLFLKFYLIGSK